MTDHTTTWSTDKGISLSGDTFLETGGLYDRQMTCDFVLTGFSVQVGIPDYNQDFMTELIVDGRVIEILELKRGLGSVSRPGLRSSGTVLRKGEWVRVRISCRDPQKGDSAFNCVEVEVRYRPLAAAEIVGLGQGWDDDPLSMGRMANGVRL